MNGKLGNNNSLGFQGKIAVVTNTLSNSEVDFHSADRLLEKYGTDKIIHLTLPKDFMAERDKMIDSIAALAADREIKAIIINQAVGGSCAAIAKFKETRDDVFIVFCTAHEPVDITVKHANLLLRPNETYMGQAMVMQAKKQGAKVFIFYSFPRHAVIYAGCREMVRKTCESEGIMFVESTVLDPTGESGKVKAQQFILDDVPKMTAKYGEDTAFFCTNCQLQVTLIKAVVENHALYPQPCCPSPIHGFPEALGIKTDGYQNDLIYVIGEACRISAEKNMTDRLSTWPVSASMMFTTAGAEYAIKWMNNEVPKEEINSRVLEECMSTFIEEVVGEQSNVYITSNNYNGITYDNFKLVLMSYLDF